MADNSTILEKLDGLVARFEEISTLITDPAVIADQKRYVKLTKEYKDLDDLMKARKEYIQLLGNIEEAKNILSNESDADMREMAKEEMDPSKPVYLLCYSGNKCAKTGISVMKDAGFDVDNLFIIENGAKDKDIQAAFVTE